VVTAGLNVAYPDLAPPPARPAEPGKSITGDAAAVAAGLRAFADEGVGHAICALEPATPEALGRLTEAVALFRAG